ncbi:MAG: Fe2+-dependent dioxygenase [Phenylobacterium sp.]|nr:Fe2+-dependent dioxygenase [Phenylobacterium sp.]
MILQIEGVLDAGQVARFRADLEAAPWADGKVTAGYQSARAKDNDQLPEDCDVAHRLGREVLDALGRNLLFQTATLPDAIFPPLFNRYAGGQAFGAHVDNAWRPLASGGRLRTDVSATLFLSEPDSYDGGELVIEDIHGAQAFKLAAGDMLVYPATTLHRVAPVTRGVRIASFFWVQSLVADASRRGILFDIDMGVQSLRPRVGDDDPALVALTGAYHNLLRAWSAP